MTDKSDINSELKPVSKVATITQKAIAIPTVFVGVCSVAAGAFLVAKHNDVKLQSNLKVSGGQVAALGGITLAGGTIASLLGMLGVKTASGASRARKFAEKEELRRDIADKSQQLGEMDRGR